MKNETDYTLDLRDTIAPFALLKITQALREMKPGDQLEILAIDDDTRKYLFQVLNAHGQYCMVDIKEQKDLYRMLLKKKDMDP